MPTNRPGPRNPSRSGNPAVRTAAAYQQQDRRRQSGSTSPQRPRPQPRPRLVLGILLTAVVLIVIAAVAVIAHQRSHADPEPPAAQPSFAPVSLTNGQPIRLGQDDAPVTLTLFEDFNCPHCADFEKNLGPTITDLQRSGRVKVELYPMSFVTKRSPALANAMACAATEGFGQSYWIGLFSNNGLSWSDDQLIRLGTLVGKPSPDFAGCVRSDAHRAWVDSITSAASAKNVTETPTVFINGVRQPADKVSGWTAADLKSAIGAAT
jgi:protein-disulfide isomerase